MATTVTLSTPDGEMGLYEAEPEGEARAAVIVAQEAFGVNPHIEDVTRRFAAGCGPSPPGATRSGPTPSGSSRSASCSGPGP